MNLLKMILCGVLVCICGCSSAPDIVSSNKSKGEKYSVDDVRRITVDQPFMISGDYFRERDEKQNISTGKSTSEDTKTTPSTPKPETAAEINKESSFPIKIAVMASRNIGSAIIDKIAATAFQAEKSFPIVYINSEEIKDALPDADCLKDMPCASKKLGLYPGVRMLIAFERFELPEKFPALATASFVITDTAFNFQYPVVETSKMIQQQNDYSVYLQEVLGSAISFSLKKSEIIPSFCRSFSSENMAFYITAGKLSGLKPGDRLNVYFQGKMVKSPTGIPAGWIPGKPKGMVKVEQLFGKDFAACSLLEGDAPMPEDMIVKPSVSGKP